MTSLIRLSSEDVELLIDCLDEILNLGAKDTFPHKCEEIKNMISYLNLQMMSPVAEITPVGSVLLTGGLMDNEILSELADDT